MLKEISVIAIALTVIGSTGLQAKEANINNNQVVSAVQENDSVSKGDAKKIMKKYLKSKKSYKKYKIGKIKKSKDFWAVKITSNDVPISTAYVNDKTGKITYKR